MKGFLLIVSLTLAVASMFFYLFPSVILVFFSHFPFILRLRQQINLQLNEIYFEFAAFLLYYLCSIKVILHLSDKSVLQDQSFLVICNHRSTVDMMFTAWCYATFLDTYPHLLFILKDTLRSLPFFGYCMQILMYIFLSRKKEQDVPHIHSMLGYMSRNYCAAQSVVIFPEGTDLSPSNILKNTQYAQSKGLPILQQVMYPRPVGFLTLIDLYKQSLAQHKPAIQLLHDMTLVYKDRVKGHRTTHNSFIQGKFPLEVHIYVKRHIIAELPSKPAELEQWLLDRFYEKEKLLEACYSHDAHHKNSDTYPYVYTQRHEQRTLLYASMMFVLMLGLMTVLYMYVYARYVAVMYMGVFVLLSYMDGFDRLVLGIS